MIRSMYKIKQTSENKKRRNFNIRYQCVGTEKEKYTFIERMKTVDRR
jgi:hypothetical protein